MLKGINLTHYYFKDQLEHLGIKYNTIREDENMQCPYCFSTIADSAHFCRTCGAAAPQVRERQTSPEYQEHGLHPTGAASSRRLLIIVTFLVVFMLIVSVSFAAFSPGSTRGSGGGGGGSMGGTNVNSSSSPLSSTVAVPDLMGLTQTDAEQLLRQQNLVPRVMKRASSSDTGLVFDCNPPAGSLISTNSIVSLTVSTGSATSKIPSGNRYVDSDFNFSFTIPSNWEASTAEIAAFVPDEDDVSLLTAFTYPDIERIPVVAFYDLGEGSTLQTDELLIIQELTLLLQEDNAELTLVSNKRITVGGKPAVQMVFDGIAKQYQARLNATCLNVRNTSSGEKHIIMGVFETERSSYSRQIFYLTNLLDSFRYTH